MIKSPLLLKHVTLLQLPVRLYRKRYSSFMVILKQILRLLHIPLFVPYVILPEIAAA